MNFGYLSPALGMTVAPETPEHIHTDQLDTNTVGAELTARFEGAT